MLRQKRKLKLRDCVVLAIELKKGWCGRVDSNHHGIATASPSSWCVCQFRHDRVNLLSIPKPLRRSNRGEKNLPELETDLDARDSIHPRAPAKI